MKVRTRFIKGIKALSEASGNPYDELYSLFEDLLNLSKAEVWQYPPINDLFAPTAPLIYVQVLPAYKPAPMLGDLGPRYQERGLRKQLKAVKKAQKHFSKGFGKMERKNKELYSTLELSKPLDVVQQYAMELERQITETMYGKV